VPTPPLNFFELNRLRMAGNYDAALALCEALGRTYPDNVEVAVQLGKCRLLQEDFAGAQAAFTRAARLKDQEESQKADHVRIEQLSFSSCKVKHDLEQLEYLVGKGRLPETVLETVVTCRKALSVLSDSVPPDQIGRIPAQIYPLVKSFYNRLINIYQPPELNGPALNPDTDFRKLEDRYLDGDLPIIYIDDFLTADALSELRRMTLESTFWFDIKATYVGSYVRNGFCSALLFQIAREIKERMPRIIQQHRLHQCWAYRYDSTLDGIRLHADIAAVNINLWITPNEANLDPNRGGMVVYGAKPPATWGHREYNNPLATPKVREYLASSGAGSVNVPYRANRAVIFDSSLFHETDELSFKEGFKNRRTNITYLFGDRVV
jgi:tetratricopeptide (TPR) repeat protein